jgi:hypothetical protein
MSGQCFASRLGCSELRDTQVQVFAITYTFLDDILLTVGQPPRSMGHADVLR